MSLTSIYPLDPLQLFYLLLKCKKCNCMSYRTRTNFFLKTPNFIQIFPNTEKRFWFGFLRTFYEKQLGTSGSTNFQPHTKSSYFIKKIEYTTENIMFLATTVKSVASMPELPGQTTAKPATDSFGSLELSVFVATLAVIAAGALVALVFIIVRSFSRNVKPQGILRMPVISNEVSRILLDDMHCSCSVFIYWLNLNSIQNVRQPAGIPRKKPSNLRNSTRSSRFQEGTLPYRYGTRVTNKWNMSCNLPSSEGCCSANNRQLTKLVFVLCFFVLQTSRKWKQLLAEDEFKSISLKSTLLPTKPVSPKQEISLKSTLLPTKPEVKPQKLKPLPTKRVCREETWLGNDRQLTKLLFVFRLFVLQPSKKWKQLLAEEEFKSISLKSKPLPTKRVCREEIWLEGYCLNNGRQMIKGVSVLSSFVLQPSKKWKQLLAEEEFKSISLKSKPLPTKRVCREEIWLEGYCLNNDRQMTKGVSVLSSFVLQPSRK